MVQKNVMTPLCALFWEKRIHLVAPFMIATARETTHTDQLRPAVHIRAVQLAPTGARFALHQLILLKQVREGWLR